MWKRVVCLMLGIAMCLPLAACGGPSKDTLYVLSYKPEYKEFFDYVNELYLSENPDIKKIDYKAVDVNDYNTILNSRLQSKYLDVFTSEVAYMMQGSANYMQPLDRSKFADVKDDIIEQGSYYDPKSGKDAEFLTLPMETVGSVVFYNKTIFEEYSQSEPTTWSEFIALCEKFADVAKYPVTGKTRIEAPFVFGGKSEWPSLTVLNAIVADTIELNDPTFFDDVKDYDNKPQARFNNANWVSAFSKLESIAKFIPSEQYGLDYAYVPTYFSNGNSSGKKYPMMMDGTWVYSQLKTDFELGAFVLPAEENPVNSMGKKNFATKPGMTVSVYNKSNKISAANRYVELLVRPEVYAKFLQLTKTPSVLKSASQTDEFINGIFDDSKYTQKGMYDSSMPRYMPLPSASELINLMKGGIKPDKVASNLHAQVEAAKSDWQKYINLAHKKP